MNRYFEKLYIQNKDLVYRTAYSILKNESDAEDVSAEVFCKLYSYLKANRNIRNISGWLRITARTTSIDLLRRKCSSGYLIQSDL
ncbi:MAG: sigma-70 family RNA polymerase sigma factor [Lachnospiraceae bacterium]|nr:sigma-70 family RNA polymerase sigma factor [Lachnospiraceae bacterium]